MTQIRGIKQGLSDISVDIEETSDFSSFFNVFGWKEEYNKGFHTLTVSGSDKLQRGTYIRIEILDEGGRPIPINLPSSSNKYEKQYLPSRRIAFEITQQTLNGVATMTFIGTTKKGKTVRFKKSFAINKNIQMNALIERGEWDKDEYYEGNNVVQYQGSSYVCILRHQASPSLTPKNGTYWRVFAKGGTSTTIGLTRSLITIPFDSAGVGSYGTNTSTRVFIREGSTDVTQDWTIDVTLVSGDAEFTFINNVLTVTSISENTESEIVITAEKGDDTLEQQLTILTTSSAIGKDAKLISIEFDSQIFRKDSNGNLNPSSITLTANLQNISGNVEWKNKDTDAVISNNVSGVKNEILEVFPSLFDSNSTLTIQAEADGFISLVTLAIIQDGIDGDDPYLALLSNYSHNVPTQSDGSPIVGVSYINAISTLTIYKGSQNVTNTFNISVGADTTLDPLDYSLVGDTVTVNNMTNDSEIFVFVATKTGEPTIVQTFALSKSRRGQDGGEATGIILIFRGIYNSNLTYERTSQYADVVAYVGSYWVVSEGVSNTSDEPIATSSNWTEIPTYQNLATDLLLAKDVTIRRSLTMGEQGDFGNIGGGVIRSLGGFDSNGDVTINQNLIDTRYYELTKDGISAHKGVIGDFIIDNDLIKSSNDSIILRSNGTFDLASGILSGTTDTITMGPNASNQIIVNSLGIDITGNIIDIIAGSGNNKMYLTTKGLDVNQDNSGFERGLFFGDDIEAVFDEIWLTQDNVRGAFIGVNADGDYQLSVANTTPTVNNLLHFNTGGQFELKVKNGKVDLGNVFSLDTLTNDAMISGWNINQEKIFNSDSGNFIEIGNGEFGDDYGIHLGVNNDNRMSFGINQFHHRFRVYKDGNAIINIGSAQNRISGAYFNMDSMWSVNNGNNTSGGNFGENGLYMNWRFNKFSLGNNILFDDGDAILSSVNLENAFITSPTGEVLTSLSPSGKSQKILDYTVTKKYVKRLTNISGLVGDRITGNFEPNSSISFLFHVVYSDGTGSTFNKSELIQAIVATDTSGLATSFQYGIINSVDTSWDANMVLELSNDDTHIVMRDINDTSKRIVVQIEESIINNLTSTSAPPTPTLNSSSGTTFIRLFWNSLWGVSEYVLERQTSSTTWSVLGTSINTEFFDYSVNAGVIYEYRIKAVNSVGESAYSTVVSDSI